MSCRGDRLSTFPSFPPDHEVAKQAVEVIGILEGVRRTAGGMTT